MAGGCMWDSLRVRSSWGQQRSRKVSYPFAGFSSRNATWPLQGRRENLKKTTGAGWRCWLRSHWETTQTCFSLKEQKAYSAVGRTGYEGTGEIPLQLGEGNFTHIQPQPPTHLKNKYLILRQKGLKSVDWEHCWIPIASGGRDWPRRALSLEEGQVHL